MERQLRFDNSFNITDIPVPKWKVYDDVPYNIRSVLEKIPFNRIIYSIDTDEYHCPKCLEELDNDYYCSTCDIKYSNISKKYIINCFDKEILDTNEWVYSYVFNIEDDEVFLYCFLIKSYYFKDPYFKPRMIVNVEIDKKYHVSSDGIFDIDKECLYSYEDYFNIINSNDLDSDYYSVFDNSNKVSFIYKDNLSMLMDISFYKYSNIWILDNYLDINNFTLSSLTFYPIYCRQFEYLVKMGLYNLAVNASNLIEYKRSFEETFGVDKKYYSFMRDNDIDYSILRILRFYPTTDIDLISFVSEYDYIFEDLSKIVDLAKLKKYFDKNDLHMDDTFEYDDYIEGCLKLGLDLKDKSILFPDNLNEAHDRVITECIITSDPLVDEKIKNISNVLSFNKYEDDKYIIFPASSVMSLIDESTQQSNCVRMYCERIARGDSQIYFMREKESINKSLVTIEVRDGKIVQARTKFNEKTTDEQNKVLEKWERQLLLIESSDE